MVSKVSPSDMHDPREVLERAQALSVELATSRRASKRWPSILRADPSTAHIPIIALSANAVPGDVQKAIDAGFFNYLTKPIKVSEFMDALDAALILSQQAPATPGKERA